MEIGERVKKLRALRGLSQNQLAKRVGIKQASLSRLEGGVSQTLRADNALKLARELGTTVDYILSDRQKPSIVDLVGHDPAVDVLVELYADCDEKAREELLDFARFVNSKSSH